jgi:hypothetical protein
METKTLLEKYAPRIEVAESVYSKATGETMDNNRKACVAMVLDNETKFLNEAFSNSVGTQRADLGAWKKFCLNLTTVALPTLIAHELVIVNPMASYSGYITYVQYTSGTNKGMTKQGDVFNDPFRLGKVDVNFTGSAIVEEVKLASGEESKEVTLAWTPVVEDAFGKGKTVKFIPEEGEASFLPVHDGKVTVSANGRIAYMYDNERIPQNDLPIVNAEIKSLPLVAKARRVAVYYSQIAAFQAKQDYGFDLGDQLAEKACGQLAYEIDTEITDLLIGMAKEDAELVWSKSIPVGISKAQHYEGFAEIVDIASSKIYAKTKRFAPTYMLCARNVINVLGFLNGFKAASVAHINGPYLAGTLNGLKVFVTPNIEDGKFILGVNGDDFMSSAAVYAPYMAVVPTQLLGYADGAMSQGFSTMYALEKLNEDLVIAGRITTEAAPAHVVIEG